jgi:hypothetical protein
VDLEKVVPHVGHRAPSTPNPRRHENIPSDDVQRVDVYVNTTAHAKRRALFSFVPRRRPRGRLGDAPETCPPARDSPPRSRLQTRPSAGSEDVVCRAAAICGVAVPRHALSSPEKCPARDRTRGARHEIQSGTNAISNSRTFLRLFTCSEGRSWYTPSKAIIILLGRWARRSKL